MRRNWFKIVLLALTLAVVSAGVALAGEKVLKVGSPWAPKTLDVQKSGYAFQRLGVVQALAGVDENLKLTPLLAEKWTVSDDKLTWTFSLRDDVVFHDGTQLTAKVFEQNLKRLKQKGSILKSVPLKEIKALDDHTLTVSTSIPFAPLLAYLCKGEAGALAPSSFDQDGNIVKVVGTGPFMVESCTLKREMRLKRNDNYWGEEKAKVDKVVYRGVPDALTRLAMIRSGELDIAQILPPEAIESLKASGLEIRTKPIGRCRMATFNMAQGPFTDFTVRQAVNLAINREDLVKYVLEGVGQEAATLFPPQVYWSNTKLKAFPYDPAKAKKLLAEAGWKDTDGDNVLDKDGEKFEFDIITYPERAALPPTAEVIQSQLAEVDIKANVVVNQVDTTRSLRDAGKFGMCIVGRGLFFVPDPDFNLTKDYQSKNTHKPGWGAFHYTNAKVDELLVNGRDEFAPDKRKLIYDEIQKILLQDQPMAYLNYYVNVDCTSPRVKGYVMHPIEYTFGLENVEIK